MIDRVGLILLVQRRRKLRGRGEDATERCVAIQDFNATKDSELTIHKGDVITVLERDGNYVRGTKKPTAILPPNAS